MMRLLLLETVSEVALLRTTVRRALAGANWADSIDATDLEVLAGFMERYGRQDAHEIRSMRLLRSERRVLADVLERRWTRGVNRADEIMDRDMARLIPALCEER